MSVTNTTRTTIAEKNATIIFTTEMFADHPFYDSSDTFR